VQLSVPRRFRADFAQRTSEQALLTKTAVTSLRSGASAFAWLGSRRASFVECWAGCGPEAPLANAGGDSVAGRLAGESLVLICVPGYAPGRWQLILRICGRLSRRRSGEIWLNAVRIGVGGQCLRVVDALPVLERFGLVGVLQ
jgi:hypothetical protein